MISIELQMDSQDMYAFIHLCLALNKTFISLSWSFFKLLSYSLVEKLISGATQVLDYFQPKIVSLWIEIFPQHKIEERMKFAIFHHKVISFDSVWTRKLVHPST